MSGYYGDSSPVHRTSPHPTRSGKSSPWPSISLSHVHISEALLRSPDDGVTLDLSHTALTDIGESGVEKLATIGREDLIEDECSVQRITLGHNHLTTLPMAFALLSRLRYLNLKSNNFIVFPDVLTVMPTLEILDIARNKIKRFPSQPGSLVNLKVFSMSRNKITRLPTYFTQLQRLTLFQVDYNPIEWPPRDVMENSGGSEGSLAMKNWIQDVQKWIANNAPFADGRKPSHSEYVESPAHEPSDDPSDSRFRFPVPDHNFDPSITPHARSFSIDSDISINSDINRVQNGLQASDIPSPLGPPRLYVDPLSPVLSKTSSPSPSRSPDRYLPTPEESIASADEDLTQAHQHVRNASYASSGGKPTRPLLLSKKSLPDLRTAKVQFRPNQKEGMLPPALPPPRDLTLPELPQPSPVSLRQDSSSSEGGTAKMSNIRPFAVGTSMSSSPTTLDRPIPSMDIERNSYFRRLSTLPSSTISKTIPDSLLSLVDAVRGILFGVSQVYQTLQHYTVYAIDERLSSVLMKVLDPASTYMAQLINALDRFDSISRRTLPHPSVCRAVVESCKDNMAVFGKAIGVLALQLKVLAMRDDVRYTRQMLLVLYGATAEISNAWQAIIPNIAAVEPLLRDHRPPPASKMNSSQGSTSWSTMLPTSETSEEGTLPLFSPSHPSAQPLMRSQSAQPPNRGMINRRHAGSFSSRDVEVGKTLPSYIEPLHRPTGIIKGVAAESPVSRTALRSATASPSLTSPLHQPVASSSRIDPYMVNGRSRDAHSRQTSVSSLKTFSNQPSPQAPSRPPLLEIPTNSTTLVDKEALEAMHTAVEAAPVVWELISKILNDAQDEREDLRDSLAKAKIVTNSLSENIQLVLDNDPRADRKTLREDAHVFVKTVVQLSNAIKSYREDHPVSPHLRSNMVKLTNATEEFVILLHVSSFSPSATPRPFSPMISNSTPVPEDGRLGASLSRSRSALAPATSKLAPTPRDGPRSALAHQQMFKLSTPSRPGASRDYGEFGASLGSLQ